VFFQNEWKIPQKMKKSKKISKYETGKNELKKKNKIEVNSSEASKPRLISQSHKPLNSKPKLNWKAKYKTNSMVKGEIN